MHTFPNVAELLPIIRISVFLCFIVQTCFLLHNFFKFFVNQGRLCLDEVKKCGTYIFIDNVCDFGGYNVPFVIDGRVIV